MSGPFRSLRARFAGSNGSDEALARDRKLVRRWRKRGRQWQSRSYYPAMLDIAGRQALVVGAGKVGEGKVEGLLNAEAKVRVVSKTATPKVTRLAGQGKIELELRPYRSSDLDGCFLVIAATEDNDTNVEVFNDAETRRMLCNVVDVTHLCNFILPSVVRRGDLSIAVSTGGASPAMARRIRFAIGQCYGDEYEVALEILGSLRDELKARYPASDERKIIFERMVYSSFMELIRAGRAEELAAWVQKCIDEGPGYASGAEHRQMLEKADPECKLRFQPIPLEKAPLGAG